MSNSLTKYHDFDTVDELLGKWFGEPKNLVVNCKNKDMSPVCWEEAPNGYKATCRTVGIRPEDVKVILKDDNIHVSGKSVLDNYDYCVSYNLPLDWNIRNNIECIDYRTQDGITIVYLNVKKGFKKGIDIRRI
ncbi:hypothetical protein ACJDU8_02660 [Clostridium sp. WILCCON 0269]|uniref:SHSP domain-containing protein n=1 Tax=Candidatus Clostridium eludens TaxID=3381663 RepID=A0ABW8SG11_9CLOT